MKYWWQRPDLHYKDGELIFAGHTVSALAKRAGTPTFFYHGKRVIEKLTLLHTHLNQAGFERRFKVYYAIKANRFAPLITMLKQSDMCGIDACSPQEIEHAVSCGFRSDQISFTATSLSEEDFQLLARYPDVHVNCDSMHAIRRLGELCPGREIGLRINPEIGVGYGMNEKLTYSGKQSSKFGIYRQQFAEALAMANQHRLTITKIHFHTGCGYLNRQLDQWDKVIDTCQSFIQQIPTLKAINVGGGLGVPHVADDPQLDLERWAAILAKHFEGTTLNIEVEPGDYLLKDAGILLLTANSVEMKANTRFVGVNAGFNIALEPAVYGLPFEPVVVSPRGDETEIVTLAGNINEALDIWYRDIPLPPLQSGDTIALLNCGAYSSAMSSNHCMRGHFKEFLLL